jgi:hypothetical protein
MERSRNETVRAALALTGLPAAFTMEQLHQRFKQLAVRCHPDKPGGSHGAFNSLKCAVTELVKDFELRRHDRQFYELKEQALSDLRGPTLRHAAGHRPEERHPGEGGPAPRSTHAFDQARFNCDFERCREPNAYSEGYGDMMAPSSSEREDIEVPRMQGAFEPSRFNSEFQRLTRPEPGHRHLATRPPSALVTGYGRRQGCGGYMELDCSHVDDFGGRTSKLEFGDYRLSHSTTRLVNPDSVPSREAFRTVQDFARHRDQVTDAPLTESELLQAAEQWS